MTSLPPAPPAGRTVIVPGLAMPFFPARPMTGIVLSTPEQAMAQLSRDLDAGFVCQRKMNGDRSCLGIFNGENGPQILVQNRHGGWTKQSVKNAADFLFMGPGSCLDGEIMPGGLFHPFEVLAWGGVSLVNANTSERIRAARLASVEAGRPYLFDFPIEPSYVAIARRETAKWKADPLRTWVSHLRANLPDCEGYVRKAETAYPIGRSAIAETTSWAKSKW